MIGNELLENKTRKYGASVNRSTQDADNYLTERGKNAAFKDWINKLNLGDRLPRGKFFKGKSVKKPVIIMDEFHLFTNTERFTFSGEDHAKSFVQLGLASSFDGSLESLKPSIIEYCSENSLTSIMVGNLALSRFAQLVVEELSPIYGICHTYDIGDQTVFCSYSNFAPSAADLAVFLQFKAEELIDEAVIVSHKTTAKYLELFGAQRIEAKPCGTILSLDMYIEREQRCGTWFATRFVELGNQYSGITEAFIKEQDASDSTAFEV